MAIVMERFTWTQDGEAGGAPAWRGACGDYEARVNRMHPGGFGSHAGRWNWRVNNSGRMGCVTVEEAKAAADHALQTRLRIRVDEAKATMRTFPHRFSEEGA